MIGLPKKVAQGKVQREGMKHLFFEEDAMLTSNTSLECLGRLGRTNGVRGCHFRKDPIEDQESTATPTRTKLSMRAMWTSGLSSMGSAARDRASSPSPRGGIGHVPVPGTGQEKHSEMGDSQPGL